MTNMELETSFEIAPEEEIIDKITPKKKHNCETCQYSTTDKSNFNKHKKTHGTSNEKISFLCDSCGKDFTTKFGLTLHTKNKHAFTFKHECSICNKGFNQSVQYRYHVASHMQVALDQCSFCKKKFSSHGSLKRHLEICSNVPRNSFVCDSCQACFPYKYRLDEHIKGKHGEPRFQCSLCGKRFAWRSSLKAHMTASHCNTDDH